MVSVRSAELNWKSTCFWFEIVIDVEGSLMFWIESPGPVVTVKRFGFRTVIELPILTNWFSNWRLTLPAATRLFSRITRVSLVIRFGVRSALLGIWGPHQDPGAEPLVC